MADWQKIFEEKLGTLFSVKESLSEDEAAKMGRKDPEQEVEKFVLSNTQELGKDKWLCPLSGKKFKVCDITCSFVHLVSLGHAGELIKQRVLEYSLQEYTISVFLLWHFVTWHFFFFYYLWNILCIFEWILIGSI